jgi:beta-glucanase (GH16 family)
MGIVHLIAQAATLGATNVSINEPLAVPATVPTFADEFTGPRIDTTAWRFDTFRNPQGWFNNEKQYYSDDRPRNARVENGVLVIEAHREVLDRSEFPDWGGQDYTSAKLVSRQARGYGVYEVRAKIPCGRGTWPAIWLLPTGTKWPDGGEIDVMEHVGWDPTVVHATLHTAAFNHAKGTQRGAQIRVPDACEAFHNYQLDWRPDSITIGMDGRAFMRVRDDQPGGAAAWPFTRPYELILNLAIGGDWGGQKGIDDAALPAQFHIDYVRYWAPTEN